MDASCYFDKVWITFIVETDGSLSALVTEIPDDFSCMESRQFTELKKQLDEGLRDYLNEMTAWKPGECKGIKVPVRYRFPIRLHLVFD